MTLLFFVILACALLPRLWNCFRQLWHRSERQVHASIPNHHPSPRRWSSLRWHHYRRLGVSQGLRGGGRPNSSYRDNTTDHPKSVSRLRICLWRQKLHSSSRIVSVSHLSRICDCDTWLLDFIIHLTLFKYFLIVQFCAKMFAEGQHKIGVARGAKRAMPPKCLAYFVVLCFQRRCPTPNTVARLKSEIFGPFLSLGLTTLLQHNGPQAMYVQSKPFWSLCLWWYYH